MTSEEEIHRANMAGELVQVRDGQLHFIYVAMRSARINCTAHTFCTYLYYCNDIVNYCIMRIND